MAAKSPTVRAQFQSHQFWNQLQNHHNQLISSSPPSNFFINPSIPVNVLIPSIHPLKRVLTYRRCRPPAKLPKLALQTRQNSPSPKLSMILKPAYQTWRRNWDLCNSTLPEKYYPHDFEDSIINDRSMLEVERKPLSFSSLSHFCLHSTKFNNGMSTYLTFLSCGSLADI